MLTDYDAKGIADVMGIAFLRSRKASSASSTGAAKPRQRTQLKAGTAAGQYTIFMDDHPLRIVYTGISNGSTSHRLAQHAKACRRADEAAGGDQIQPPTAVLIEKAVEIGLPRLALRHVAEELAGDDKAKIASLEWVVVPRTTLERREEQLSPQESERTERVARLFVHARRALGTEAEAREFMTAPHPRLDGRSPIDAARTDLGTRRVEQILNALEFGLAL